MYSFFTLFDLLEWLGPLLGVFLGAWWAYERFGVFGGLLGAVFGGFLGLISGRLPFFLSLEWLKRDIRRCSSERLRERLQREYWISHYLLAGLAMRGEDIQTERCLVLEWLRSDVFGCRNSGLKTLRLWYPGVAEKLIDYDPAASAESCREKVNTFVSKDAH